MNLARYGQRLVAFSVSIVAIVALINAIIDPYLYFNFLSVDGINAQRTSLVNVRSRTAKAAILKHCAKDVLIFGSSRAELGLRENFQGYLGSSVYNTALAGSNMYEMHQVLKFAAQHQNPRTVIIGLDFESFSNSRGIIADFSDSEFSTVLGGRAITSYLRYLLSPQTLAASWITLKSNNASAPTLCSSKGHLNVSNQMINHRRAFSSVIVKMLVKPGAYAAFRYSDSRLNMFEEAISAIHKGETDVLLFFSPIHARQTEVIQGLGLYDTYEQWKSDVTHSVEVIKSRTLGQGRLELWDFSGYNSITTETVPALDSEAKMRWYRESSHYSRATGDIVVNKLMQLDKNNFPDFGQQLTVDALVNHFTAQRAAATRYQLSNTDEILDVQQTIKRTEPERKRIERSLGY